MANNEYNPDVLNCIANLSNDEVFTPPTLANQVLDMLPEELFCDPTTTFIDPFCKSGVFLREIVKRLDRGLAEHIPDRQKRIDHIMHHQVYGIALTELTSLLSRRTLYCSKKANSPHSVSFFENEQGNVQYKAIKHTWVNGKCKYCGASQDVYDRGNESEQYAYQFIHTDKPEKLFPKDMKFDVIIGNPPYQMSDGGGRDSSAISLYHLFVKQAKRLSPNYLIMIIPARWYSGGKGLDDFREEMLHDSQIKEIHDFPETKDCFPGLNIRGGICYFLWKKGYKGRCTITNYYKGEQSVDIRDLIEKGSSIFIRYNKSVPIFHKVQMFHETTLNQYVSSRKPFGFSSNFAAFKEFKSPLFDIKLYRFGTLGYINKEQVLLNNQWISKYKVLVSKASPGGDEYPHSIVSEPIIAEPGSVCTETYLVIKDFDNYKEAVNLVSYIKTRFFRFMMSYVKNTQNISKASYQFVPLQDFSHPWTDEMLYEKYGLDEKEIAFIESMIRPME